MKKRDKVLNTLIASMFGILSGVSLSVFDAPFWASFMLFINVSYIFSAEFNILDKIDEINQSK